MTAAALADVSEDTALSFTKAKLAPLLEGANPHAWQMFERAFPEVWQAEVGRWLLAAQEHGYLDELLRELSQVASRANGADPSVVGRAFASVLVRLVKAMSAYYFARTGWSFRAWRPASFRQEVPQRAVDFVLGAPDGRDVLVQVRVPGVSATAREGVGRAEHGDEPVWMEMLTGAGKLPRPARGPSLLVVHRDRRASFARRPAQVGRMLLGTTVRENNVVSIPSVYRGAFFDDAWNHIGAVVLLDNVRDTAALSYICTVYINPNAELAARCDPSWFRGARVCRVENGDVRWSEPPALSVPGAARPDADAPGQTIEEGPDEVLEGTRIEPDASVQVFQAMSPSLLDDLVVGPSLRHLRDHDPDVLAMVAEVDQSLIWDALSQSPELRLRRSAQMARILQEAKHVPR